jgi:hypothetical protein
MMNHVATLSQLVCTAFGVAGILWGASARHATFETLTSHELKILDAEGRERIVLSCPTPGRSEVKLLNGAGQARAVLSVTSGQEGGADPRPTDDTRLDILDRKGSRMASFFVEDGYHHGPHQGLAYYYGDAKPAIALEVSQGMASGPHLSFWSGRPNGRVVSLAAGQASDAPSLLLRSEGIDERIGAGGKGFVYLGYGLKGVHDSGPGTVMEMRFEDAGVRLDVDKDGQGRVLTMRRGGEFEGVGGD